MKAKLRCHTPAKAQTNFRKPQRTRMNRADRRLNVRSLVAACIASD